MPKLKKPTKRVIAEIINKYNLIRDFACPINVVDNVYNLIEPTEESIEEVINE